VSASRCVCCVSWPAQSESCENPNDRVYFFRSKVIKMKKKWKLNT
jgi:hypothetical protein